MQFKKLQIQSLKMKIYQKLVKILSFRIIKKTIKKNKKHINLIKSHLKY